MRWSAACLCGIFTLITVTGCSLFRRGAPGVAAPEPDYSYSPPLTAEPSGYAAADRSPYAAERPGLGRVERPVRTAPDPYATYALDAPQGSESARVGAAPTSLASSAPKYHTVVKRDTLYSIARMYYGDQRKWKAIFEANRDSIADPNMIRVGQRLLLP